MPDADEGEGSAQNTGKRTRRKNWTDPEIFAAVHAGLGTNEKLSTGRNSPERMNAMQHAFVTRVKYMADKDLWRCVKGNLVTKVTPQESIEMRCVSITAATKDCPVAAQLANIPSRYIYSWHPEHHRRRQQWEKKGGDGGVCVGMVGQRAWSCVGVPA